MNHPLDVVALFPTLLRAVARGCEVLSEAGQLLSAGARECQRKKSEQYISLAAKRRQRYIASRCRSRCELGSQLAHLRRILQLRNRHLITVSC